MATTTVPGNDFRDRFIEGLPDAPQTSSFGGDGEETPSDVLELEDGSAIVTTAGAVSSRESDFGQNLAEVLDDAALRTISQRYLELIDRDIEARKKRDEQYEEGIRRTGMGNDAPGGANFTGASKTVHPVMAEACVDFEASAIKELFPPIGPVKTHIIGDAEKGDIERAERKRMYMNWQLTVQMPEYRPELERLLTQLPLGGSQYQKFHWDERLKKPESEFVPVDNLIIPFWASSFYGSSRQTHRMYLTREEFEGRVETGLYKEIPLDIVPPEPEVSKSETATRKIEGKDAEEAYNDDGLRTVYEIHTFMRISEDKEEYLPYILTIDEWSEKVIGLYRNWEENDKQRQKLDWIVDWTFIPWRGAMGVGLPHLIGGIAAAATGALRALLDSAHIQNALTAIKLKGGRIVGQSKQIELTEVAEIEAPPGVDDIRKVMMPVPFLGPSPVLFQLLGWLSEAGKGVVTTAEEKIADASNQMPVGTVMALIESGSKVFSAIHGRLHAAHSRALQILHRMNGQYLDDEVEVADLGKLVVRREDFQGSIDVIPVSDPAIFSESQRFAQLQALMQMASGDAGNPNIPWNQLELRHRMMKLMHVEDPDKLLPKQPGDFTGDPVSENLHIVMGEGTVRASQDQDHAAHIVAHLSFIVSPIVQIDPAPNPALGGILAHVREHMLMLYKEATAQSTAQIINHHQSQMPLPLSAPGALQ